jgi:hypothetical protein
LSRIICLEFQDNEVAETFVRLVDSKGFEFATVQVAAIAAAHASVVKVLAKPTQFCTCNVEYSVKNFGKSKRYGWTVHIKCRKPTENWSERHNISQAYDLLPEMRKTHGTDSGDG